jgi:hypothetical protein
MSTSTALCTNNCATGLAGQLGDNTRAEGSDLFLLAQSRVWKAVIAAHRGGAGRRGRRTYWFGISTPSRTSHVSLPGRSLQSNSLCMRADP